LECPQSRLSARNRNVGSWRISDSAGYVWRTAGIAPSQLFAWERRMLKGHASAVPAYDYVVPSAKVRELEKQVRDLERTLCRKTVEAEIPRMMCPGCASLHVSRDISCGFPVKID
jgi:hypothetical protein